MAFYHILSPGQEILLHSFCLQLPGKIVRLLITHNLYGLLFQLDLCLVLNPVLSSQWCLLSGYMASRCTGRLTFLCPPTNTFCPMLRNLEVITLLIKGGPPLCHVAGGSGRQNERKVLSGSLRERGVCSRT